MIETKTITRLYKSARVLREAIRVIREDNADSEVSTDLCIAWIKLDDAVKMIRAARDRLEDSELSEFSSSELIEKLPAESDDE